jgi:hypothetical protein
VKCYPHKKFNALSKCVFLDVPSNACSNFTLAMITGKYLLAKSVLDLNYGFKTFSEFDDLWLNGFTKSKVTHLPSLQHSGSNSLLLVG